MAASIRLDASMQSFLKLQSLGNDFVVIDARERPLELDAAQVAWLCDRRFGVGGDQLLTLLPSSRADVFMRIHNVDGREVAACGNATRAVAGLLMNERQRDSLNVETAAGEVAAWRDGEGVAIDLGRPDFRAASVRLTRDADMRCLPLSLPTKDAALLGDASALCVGGAPHVVFSVRDLSAAPVARVGALVECDPLFAQGINVGFVQVLSRDRIHLRVWERAAGLTLACGTGSCAALVVARQRGMVERAVQVKTDGGELRAHWRESDEHLILTGPFRRVFDGILTPGWGPAVR